MLYLYRLIQNHLMPFGDRSNIPVEKALSSRPDSEMHDVLSLML
jgi:hypothetical protein